jgi:hypothetical protein
MILRSGKRYQPYSRKCLSHHHKNMQLRSGQIYQFCLPRLFLRRYYLKKKESRHASIQQPKIPLEIESMIVETTLLDDKISLQYILKYMRVCVRWYTCIQRFIYRNDHYLTKLLQETIEFDDVGGVKHLFNIIDISRLGSDLENILNDAVKANAVGIVRLLIDEYGLDVNVKRPQFAENVKHRKRWTILHTACYHGHDKMVDLLIKQFGALNGKCLIYVRQLYFMSAERGCVDVMIVLNDSYKEITF